MANDAPVYMIYKAAIPPAPGLHKVEFHRGFEQLHAGAQHGHLAVWYRVPAGAELVKLDVQVVATGQIAPDFSKYIGTALLAGGNYVLHAFLVTTLEQMEAEAEAYAAEEAAPAGGNI